MLRWIFAASVVLATATAGLAKPITEFTIGNWHAGAYSNDQTDKFSHCAASATYNSNITVFVWVYDNFDWEIGFQHDSWRLAKDSEVQVGYRFDRGTWLSGKARAVETDFIRMAMGSDSTLINLFRHGSYMDLAFGGRNYGFNLTGTSRLLSGLAECVAYHLPKDTTSGTNTEEGGNGSTPAPKPGIYSGTGFIVTPDGLVVTNDHVVADCDVFALQRGADPVVGASLVHRDKTNDLALLKMEKPQEPENVASFSSRQTRAGNAVSAFGFPLAGTLSTSGNIVSGNITSLAGIDDDARMLQHSAPVQPGNSGGPLLDSAGDVIGVVNARLDDATTMRSSGSLPQNVNFAIKAPIVRSFLEAMSVGYQTAASASPDLDLASIADKARRFTVQITCARTKAN